MSKIILDADTGDCPGCVCKILSGDESKSILVQADYEAPSVASSFGWSLRSVQPQNYGYYGITCHHENTDGTVDCKHCGAKASTFIAAASEWISENDGIEADDPGYFGGDQ